MSELGLTTKTGTKINTKPEIKIDTDWYKPICYLCPYFTKAIDDSIRCEQSNNNKCLGESITVQHYETIRQTKLLIQKQVDQLKKYPPILHKKIKYRVKRIDKL